MESLSQDLVKHPTNVTHRLPDGADAAILQFANQTKELAEIVHLSMDAISAVRGMPRLLQAAARLKAIRDGEDSSRSLVRRAEDAEGLAKVAQREVERGFTLLHSTAVVALWSYLEVFAEDLLVALLMANRSLLRAEPLSKLKVSLTDFERLTRSERMRYLLRHLSKERKATKSAFEQIEDSFAAFGLSGGVDANRRRTLIELGQVRNILVHRGGKIDRRFKETCPWIRAGLNKEFKVTHDRFSRYALEALEYGSTIVGRLRQFTPRLMP